MKQNGTLLVQLFQEFCSSFNDAAPEEKEKVATEFYQWAEKQMDVLGIPHPMINLESLLQEQNKSLYIHQGSFQIQEIQDFIKKETYLKQITKNVEQVIWLRDIHSDRFLYVSPAFETIWGVSCENLFADPLVLINSVHPEDRLQVLVAGPRQDDKTFNQTYRILRPDGSVRWIFARTFLLRDPSGEASSLFCIAQDVTNQKQIDLALRKTLDRTQEQFELSRKMSLARKSEVVLKILMSSTEFRSAHRAALLFFDNSKIGPARGMDLIANWQFSQEVPVWLSEPNLYEEPALLDLFQQNHTIIIPQVQFDPRLTPAVRDFLLEGQTQTLVIFPLVASGNWLGCLLVYYEHEHQFDHNELRHLKVLVDLATITLYNLQLLEVEEESRHEAERANEIKTKFLAMISHELRTPLTSIIGFTTTLLAEDVTWEPSEQRDFILTIQQEANRLQELIDHLLDLSRLEAGMLPISLEIHSLQDIIKDAEPQFHSLTSGHIFLLEIPGTLPLIYGDARRIAQVLVNLVRNASTYAPLGTEISITANVRGHFLQINVNDQGPGIPPAENKKVFQAFRRGKDVENSSPQGAGLGLAICKGLVETQGGRIWIKKKNTPGATVCFTIPLASINSLANPLKED